LKSYRRFSQLAKVKNTLEHVAQNRIAKGQKHAGAFRPKSHCDLMNHNAREQWVFWGRFKMSHVSHEAHRIQ
jgi:hypothetical protein